MKYAIISTWNGEGYSSNNTAEVKEFENDNDAYAHIKELAKEYKRDTMNYGENNMIKFFKKKHSLKITHDNGEDQGSFQCHHLKEGDFGIVIQCNINEAEVESKIGYNAMLKMAIKQADKEELEDTDLTANEIFIGAYKEDYDYQFIKL